MATEAPDPKTFKSWEDAFQYAIPAVRRMEQQLRAEISGNRERLRTLVGASYRDLLGTANSIVGMDEQIGHVEAYLGDVGKMCNTRIVEKSLSNLNLLRGSIEEGDRDRYTLVSQLAILKRCPEVITRLLRRGGSVLLAAKILVLARLLHKKLSKKSQTVSYVELLRERLARLRRQLFARIDHRLGDFTMSRDGLVDAMSAFSLATSSSITDVLRHFHHVRAEAMTIRTASLQGKGTEIVETLRHWVQTLHETQAIFPRHIASSLLKLKSAPLFSDPAVHSMAEFDYDNHEKWIGDEIKHFIPYLIHDNLQSRAALDQLTVWASKTFHVFLKNIDGLLCSMSDPNDIESLRRECLELLLSSRSYAVGIDLVHIMNNIRDVFNGRFLGLIRTRCEALDEVFPVIDDTIRYSKFTTRKERGAFWTSTIASIDTTPSGPSFIQNLQASVIGINHDALEVTVSYRKWLSGVEHLESIISRLRDTKWVEDMYDIDDEDDVSEAIEALRSAQDSETMHTELSRSVSKSLNNLQASIYQIAEDLDNDQDTGPKAAFLLRVLRYTRHNLPSVCAGYEFAAATIVTLHNLISKHVVENTLANHQNSMFMAMTSRRVPGRLLWDGSPELPVLPSTWCLKLLRTLHFAMANIGSDLWSPEAVAKLKSTIRTRLVATSSASFEGLGGFNGRREHDSDEAITNGAGASRTATENGLPKQISTSAGGHNDSKIQLFFDVMYIHWASTSSGTTESGDSFFAHCGQVAQETGLAKDLISRIEASAGEYWKRTSLLFALLL